MKLTLLLAMTLAAPGLAVWAAELQAAGNSQDTVLAPRLRRPVAVVLSPDESLAYTVNQRSGSVSIVDLRQQRTIGELDLGKRLSGLKSLPDGRGLLAVDEAAHELLVLTFAGAAGLEVRQRLAVSPYPVDVVVSSDGSRCFVASLWSRRVTFVDLSMEAAQPARVDRVVDLDYAPRCQLLADGDRRLIVADAFGGRLGVLDVEQGSVMSVRSFPGHNVRGLGVSANGRMLVVAHQMLNELAHTVRNDVHWGLLMSNDLRWLRMASVLDNKSNFYDGAHMHPLGEAGSATGDPSHLAISRNGAVVVTLGGVGEIALGHEDDFSLHRIKVGRRPLAVAISADGSRAFVANGFGDSLSVVDLEKRETIAEVSLGPTPERSLVDKGEELFFDATLSHDSWMSCNSCHSDGHTNGLLNDNFSDASFGAPKRVLSLLGRTGTEPFAWNATTNSYEDQIRQSIEKTMQSDQPPSDKHVDALAAYLRTLPPPPSIDKARGVYDAQRAERGRRLFVKQNCVRCHAPPHYTTAGTFDVGLKDKQGNTAFNPPTLRSVGQRGPYFHDNRAADLKDVFRVYGHQLEVDLTDRQLEDLLAFLRSL